MSDTQVTGGKAAQATVVVEKVGPYGVQSNGQWIGLTSRSGLFPKQFIQGQSYVVTLYYAQSGKCYISSVLSGQLLPPPAVPAAPEPAATNPPPAAGAPSATPPPPPAPATGAPAGKPPFRRPGGFGGKSEEEQRSIARQACLKAACDVSKEDTAADAVVAKAEIFYAWVSKK
jgi:hypothetical protein